MSEQFDALTRRVRQAAHGEDDRHRPAGAQHDSVISVLAASPARPSRLRLLAVVALVLAAVSLGVVHPWAGSRPPEPAAARSAATGSRPAARPGPSATEARQSKPEPAVIESVSSAEVHRLPPAASKADGVVRPPGSGVPPAAGDELELAAYFHRAGDFEAALLHYRAVLRRNALDARAHNNLGLLYQEMSLLAESAREFERALIIDPAYTVAQSNYGVTLLRQGRLQEAAARFRGVLAVDADNVDAMVNLALAEKAAGEPDRARAWLLRALAVAPRSAAAHYNLAVLYEDVEPSRAVEHYRAFLDIPGDGFAAAQVSAVRARLAVLQGQDHRRP